MATLEQTEQNKKIFIESLVLHKGIITDACKSTGIGRTTVYDWIRLDEDFKKEVDLVNETVIDFVESKLFQKIEGVYMQDSENEVYKTPPSDTAIIFYLKTKAKKRGYVEKTEQEITINQPMIVEWGNPLDEDTTKQETK
jgi:hypothetical protein